MTFSTLFITSYPELFPGVLGASLAGRALERGIWSYDTLNLHDFGKGAHKKIDDTPYGGGAGMVMMPDVAAAAIERAGELCPDNLLVNLSPRGKLFDSSIARELSQQKGLTFICSRFEGIDQRVLDHYQPLEISIGDYVLFGGEVAAQVVMEAVLRYLPGIMGNEMTEIEESFDFGEDCSLLLEYHHYTRPPFWESRAVPDILQSGHHDKIARWRKAEAESLTRERREDIWSRYLVAKDGGSDK